LHEPEQPALEAAPDQASTDECAWQCGRCRTGRSLATQTAPAQAALSSVSPGDRIATPDLCTIGYTYTGTDAHTSALTAGHCASTAPVRDQSTGATGTFVASIVDPPRSGGADYGLLDFGPAQ